jgi:hypothetical protein
MEIYIYRAKYLLKDLREEKNDTLTVYSMKKPKN